MCRLYLFIQVHLSVVVLNEKCEPGFCFQLVPLLSTDFIKEGWLEKSGPRLNDAFRRRWVTLDKRKFMYYDDPLVSSGMLSTTDVATKEIFKI